MTSPRILRCFVPGRPASWRSPQAQPFVVGKAASGKPLIRVHMYPAKSMETWAKGARALLRIAVRDAASESGVPAAEVEESGYLRGAVKLRVSAAFARPRSAHRVLSGKPSAPMIVKPDATNVLKLAEDCATHARWWRDDAQVWDARSTTRWAICPPHRCKDGCREDPDDPEGVYLVAWEAEE